MPNDDSSDSLAGSDSDAFLREVARAPDAATPHPEPDLTGQALGKYVVGARLGEGGMGVVYEATDSVLRRKVALKVLSRKAMGDDGARARLLREARSLAAVSHSGIAAVYEVGEAAGHVFIAMERVNGRTLRAQLAEAGPLRPDEARRLVTLMAQALDHAHRAGLVHRDLKPENVMITPAGEVKILDFGLARLRAPHEPESAGQTSTLEGHLAGTPSYMSPEQARGQKVDGRSDLFALGAIFYELVTGKRAFGGSSLVEVLAAVDRDAPTPPRQVRPELPAEEERIILRCLEKSPEGRFDSAASLLAALEGRGNGPPALTAPAAASRGGRDGPGRRPRRYAVVLALAAVLSAIAALSPRLLGPAAAPAAPADEELAVGTEVAAARAAFVAGLRTYRDGDFESALAEFSRALELDPHYGAAALLQAAIIQGGDLLVARVSYQRAWRARHAMGERGQSLLEALAPCIRDEPVDPRRCEESLGSAARARPRDGLLALLHATARLLASGPVEGCVADFGRVIAVDPHLAVAWQGKGTCLAYLGRLDEARRVLEDCMARFPTAVACVSEHADVVAAQGDCRTLEADARRLLAASPSSPLPHRLLAQVALAQGAPREQVEEHVRAMARGPGVADARAMLALPLASVALMHGNPAPLREYVADSGVERAADQFSHFFVRALEAELALERGEPARAADLASDMLRRKDSWQADPNNEDAAVAKDMEPYFLALAARGGGLSTAEFEARRDAWAERWRRRLPPSFHPMVWLYGWAAVVDDEASARAALAAMPDTGPPPYTPRFPENRGVGRMYLLTGQPERALPWLRQVAHGCLGLGHRAQIAARVDLGDALARTGDREGACREYAGVIALWGRPEPRSVSAERARERAKALGCPSAPPR